MYKNSVFVCLFLYILSIGSILSFEIFGKKKFDIFLVFNNGKANEKIVFEFFQKENQVSISTVELHENKATGFTESPLTSEVLRIKAKCKKQGAKCLRALKQDLEVLVLGKGNDIKFDDAKIYYCTSREEQPDSKIFAPCFKSPSSNDLLINENDNRIHVLYIDGSYNHDRPSLIRLKKTDGSEIEISHDGSSEKKIFIAKGTSAYVREIIVENSFNWNKLDTSIIIFIEGKHKVRYNIFDESSVQPVKFKKYFPTNAIQINLRPDIESTGLKPTESKSQLIGACSSGIEIGTLLANLNSKEGESIELKVNLNEFCQDKKNSDGPYIIWKVPFVISISSFEASCENTEGVCQGLLQNNLHLITIYNEKSKKTNDIKNYFCKREKLQSGKFLYERCGEKLSEIVIQQKQKDEYIHLINLVNFPDYIANDYKLKVLMMDGTEHNLKMELWYKQVYDFLGTASEIKYFEIPYDGLKRGASFMYALKEGGKQIMYCIDLKERVSDKSSKYIQCEQ